MKGLRRIVKALSSRASSLPIPKPVLAGAVLALTLVGMFFTYGQTSTIPFHTIWWGAAAHGPSNIVINDQVTWSKIWTQAYCGPNDCLSLPEVNFTSRTVLAVFMGGEPNAGYFVNMTKVSRNGPNILVQVRLTEPGNCPALQVVTSPSHIVDIPKTEATVRFTTETFVRNC